MLTISDCPTFSRGITASRPVDGGYKKETFTAVFCVIPTDKFKSFDLDGEEGVREFLTEAIVGLSELVDDDGIEIPYSDEIRDSVLGLPYVRAALAKEYFNSVGGAHEGN